MHAGQVDVSSCSSSKCCSVGDWGASGGRAQREGLLQGGVVSQQCRRGVGGTGPAPAGSGDMRRPAGDKSAAAAVCSPHRVSLSAVLEFCGKCVALEQRLEDTVGKGNVANTSY